MENKVNSSILLTVDVEDWFQVENLRSVYPLYRWDQCELRVERNTGKILDLFDEHHIKATFFVLGWLAERRPGLVREIYRRGHEVASHGYSHVLWQNQEGQKIQRELKDSKHLLEDLIGDLVSGFRAPCFAIDGTLLELVEESGYLYDSSFNSFSLNKRYGRLRLEENARSNGISYRVSKYFYELPISNISIRGRVLPWGGGGYFRLIPKQVFNRGVQSVLKYRGGYLFYLHPWEIDPDQPREKSVPFLGRLRHYANLKGTFAKLSSLLDHFKESRFLTCWEYLQIQDCNTDVFRSLKDSFFSDSILTR